MRWSEVFIGTMNIVNLKVKHLFLANIDVTSLFILFHVVTRVTWGWLRGAWMCLDMSFFKHMAPGGVHKGHLKALYHSSLRSVHHVFFCKFKSQGFFFLRGEGNLWCPAVLRGVLPGEGQWLWTLLILPGSLTRRNTDREEKTDALYSTNTPSLSSGCTEANTYLRRLSYAHTTPHLPTHILSDGNSSVHSTTTFVFSFPIC